MGLESVGAPTRLPSVGLDSSRQARGDATSGSISEPTPEDLQRLQQVLSDPNFQAQLQLQATPPGAQPPQGSKTEKGFGEMAMDAAKLMSLEWVPWPPNAVMDSARFGIMAMGQHYLREADLAALKVARKVRPFRMIPGLSGWTGGVFRKAADAAHRGVLNGTAEAPNLVGVARGKWDPRRFLPGQRFARAAARAKPTGLPPGIAENIRGRVDLLKDVGRISEKAAQKGINATKLGASSSRRTVGYLLIPRRLLAGVAGKLPPKAVEWIGRTGRWCARFSVGMGIGWIFAAHDGIISAKIHKDPKASKLKKTLATATAFLSGLSAMAPMVPSIYKFPVISVAALLSTGTAIARDWVD